MLVTDADREMCRAAIQDLLPHMRLDDLVIMRGDRDNLNAVVVDLYAVRIVDLDFKRGRLEQSQVRSVPLNQVQATELTVEYQYARDGTRTVYSEFRRLLIR